MRPQTIQRKDDPKDPEGVYIERYERSGEEEVDLKEYVLEEYIAEVLEQLPGICEILDSIRALDSMVFSLKLATPTPEDCKTDMVSMDDLVCTSTRHCTLVMGVDKPKESSCLPV